MAVGTVIIAILAPYLHGNHISDSHGALALVTNDRGFGLPEIKAAARIISVTNQFLHHSNHAAHLID